MTSLLFKNARVFDGVSGDCAEGQWLMPGLIACADLIMLDGDPLTASGRHPLTIVRGGKLVRNEL